MKMTFAQAFLAALFNVYGNGKAPAFRSGTPKRLKHGRHGSAEKPRLRMAVIHGRVELADYPPRFR
jgi:hypothetical protein